MAGKKYGKRKRQGGGSDGEDVRWKERRKEGQDCRQTCRQGGRRKCWQEERMLFFLLQNIYFYFSKQVKSTGEIFMMHIAHRAVSLN